MYFFFFMKVLLHLSVVFNLRFTGKPGSGTLQTSGVWRHVLSVCVCVFFIYFFLLLLCVVSVVFIS